MKPIHASVLTALALTLPFDALATPTVPSPEFYSRDGREVVVRFEAQYETKFSDPQSPEKLSPEERQTYVKREIMPTLEYLFGPLTRRSIGAVLQAKEVTVDWAGAIQDGDRVRLPYLYEGVWMLQKSIVDRGRLELPLPYSTGRVLTKRWKNCTDSDPDHQTVGFYWYFWDPQRTGCEHRVGEHYQRVQVRIVDSTPNTRSTRPEYDRLFRVDPNTGEKSLRMTFAFGYAHEPARPSPDADSDVGILEYRKFIGFLRRSWRSATESAILQSEYPPGPSPELAIGRQFTGQRGDTNVVIRVVSAAGIEPMKLFAKSFAEDHDGVFSWLGHSQVGSAFEADRFKRIVSSKPENYSITDDYQVIYWGGCNSYSYYTSPFFQMKGGSKNLDIIANGLPSYFSVNATNSAVIFDAFFNWEKQMTYQTIVNRIEDQMAAWGEYVLAVVLGDEDNE